MTEARPIIGRGAPDTPEWNETDVMPQGMDELSRRTYLAAIPDNDSPLISKA
jgi:hypothetical protein